jgi:dephospho-CoA kinase
MAINEKILRIGLTGGIASGKSFVAAVFTELAVPVIDTDVIARDVVAPGQPGLEAVTREFGPGILTSAGELDRAALRRQVFADDAERHRLEAILHPLIRDRTLAASANAGGPYQVLVVPLLFETGFRQLVDRILVVDCPESMQRERLVSRDSEDPERVERIMSAQLGRQERLSGADDIIDNSGPGAQTRGQVEKLHREYLRLAGAR